ncbi:MAG: CpsD/CapB family tyrosine-protein kinase [Lachnospiraceae bacterium]|nr:CpsD/CapB family tyrosine-protein kinase [Lachnospiraceae bacterium]
MNKTELQIPGIDRFFTQEAYKVLRTNIQFCGQDIKVIAVTSAHENEGKSTLTISLAKSFSELGKRVLVIDADMRKSVLAARNTSANVTKGLSEVLTGMESIGDVLYETQYKDFYLLFAGQYPPNPAELLGGKHFESLVTAVRQNFDYILIDTPPLGEVIDSALISSKCDGTIIVSSGKTSVRKLEPVIDQLKRGNCNILGLVMNNAVQSKSKSKYYGYRQ